MRNPLLAAGLLVLLSGCASTSEAPAPATASMAATRGQAIAELRCAQCHSIGAMGDSPRMAAPTFRQLRIRYNAISWERVMAQIAEGGHDEMPPLRLDDADVSDIRAYIESLG